MVSINGTSPVTVIYNAESWDVPTDGVTVATVRQTFKALMNVPNHARPRLNGAVVQETAVVGPGGILEFVVPWGQKGGRRPKIKQHPAHNDRPIQFNWRRHWKKVEPHLKNPVVQFALDMGMTLYNSEWQSGDPPYLSGAVGTGRIVEGKLSWYQPLCRCHHIAFFAMAIGAAIYPELTWRFISGDLHTVPVGYDDGGNPRVVMDILLFDTMDASGSINYAQERLPMECPNWDSQFRWFEKHIVPAVRISVQHGVTDGQESREVAEARAWEKLKEGLAVL